MVREKDACEILRLALENKIKVFLDGGWGVDALVGKESREHNDIDLFAEEIDYNAFINVIKNYGFTETVMEYTTENHTVWKDDKNRIIDLHKFAYTENKEIMFEGDIFPSDVFSGKGKIGDIEICCIDAKKQVEFHRGYNFDENDVKDVFLLCETFGIEVPIEYEKGKKGFE